MSEVIDIESEVTSGGSGSHNAHARASASKADQWVTCPASIAYVEKLIRQGKLPAKEDRSVYADEGTRAHDYAEAYLTAYIAGTKLPPVPQEYVDNDSVGLIMSYINGVIELKGEDDLLVEVEVPLFYSANESGTVDACVLTPYSLHVRDLKWGYGVVDSRFNRQSAIYAESMIKDINDDILAEKYPDYLTIPDSFPITIGIVQPRTAMDDTVWELTYGELKAFNLEALVAHRQILTNRVFFQASIKGCKWCRARNICKFRSMMLYGLLPSNLDIGALTEDEMLMIHEASSQIKAHLSDVTSYLNARAINEGHIPDGYMIAETKKNRKYPEEQEEMREYLVGKGLTIDMWKPREIKAQTHIKKLLTPKDRKVFDKFLVKPEGVPYLTVREDYKNAYDFAAVDSALFEGGDTSSDNTPSATLFDK